MISGYIVTKKLYVNNRNCLRFSLFGHTVPHRDAGEIKLCLICYKQCEGCNALLPQISYMRSRLQKTLFIAMDGCGWRAYPKGAFGTQHPEDKVILIASAFPQSLAGADARSLT
jgi:hypothetical protein